MTPLIRPALDTSSAWSRRARLALASLALAAIAVLASLPEAGAAFRQLPGGRIGIDLPDAFAPADKFTGFVDQKTRASFAVIELDAAAYETIKTIPDTPESLAREGFGGSVKAELKGRDGTFIYLVGRQSTPAGEVTRFALMFRDKDVTGLIVANVPQASLDAGTYSREGIEAILARVQVRDAPADPQALFRFAHLGPFKQTLNDGGQTQAYNISGTKPGAGENQIAKEAMLLVSSTIHGDDIDVTAQAEKAFNELGGMKDRRVASRKDVIIGDLKGYQILGEVTDEAGGQTIAVNIVVLSGKPLGYFMVLASVPAAEQAKMMPEIEKVIASFELSK